MGDVLGRSGLDRDGLPKSAERPVPTLLAVRVFREGMVGIGLLVDRGQQRVDLEEGLARRIVRHHDLERQVAAFVPPDLAAVEANDGNLAGRAEAQHRLARPGRKRDPPAVAAETEGVAQVGAFGLPGVRHGHGAPRRLVFEAEIPRSVE